MKASELIADPAVFFERGGLADTGGAGDAAAAEAAHARQQQLVKPPGALGRLEDVAVHLARWQGRELPVLERVRIVVFAGSHGVTKQGVSAFPPEVTAQMLACFRGGMAAICQLAEVFGAELAVIDCGVDAPTGDFTQGPAMSEAEFAAAVQQGMDAVDDRQDLLIFGEMGIGNTAAAAAVSAAICGGAPESWVGRGSGVDDAGLARKRAAVAAGLARHGAQQASPLAALRLFGGREMAAILGGVAAARRRGTPVLLDGFITTASVVALGREGLPHCLAGHCSGEPGHTLLLERLGMAPLLDLDMRLGEASGAAVALGVLRAALACHNGMATFAEAAVAAKL